MAKDVEVRSENKPASAFEMVPDFERMVERFFGDRFTSMLGDWPALSPRSSFDMRETDEAFILTADIAGLSKEDIHVGVDGNLLTIRAEHTEESGREDESRGYRRQYRSFHQSLTLPSNVDSDKIEANCENGLLEVWIPKKEASNERRIEVQSGKGGFLNRLLGRRERKENTQPGSTQKH